MFSGLSLEQAPPYNIPLRFFVTASLYGVLFGVFVAFFATSLESRYEYAAIAITHALTIGFFAHVMMGASFQMIPVMLGIAYKSVVKNANIIYVLLNGGVLFFLAGFLSAVTPLLHIGASLLLFGFLYFAYLSFSTVFLSEEKDFLVQNFAASYAVLFVATIFGFIAMLGHSGFVSSVKFGDIHIALMLFGWVFLLLNAVSYRIIPMFFVASEFPKWLKSYLYRAILLLLFFFIYFRLADNFTALAYVKLLLGVCSFVFALYSILILKKRKRARSDRSITLWYFAMVNLMIASTLFIMQDFFEFDGAFFVGFFTLFGLLALIHAMLYKIVPFLTWFHLSSSMVFEAEMSEVIEQKWMKWQVWLFYASYVLFFVALFLHQLFIVAGLFFSAASFLLLKNLLQAQKYYKRLIVKKVDISAFENSSV